MASKSSFHVFHDENLPDKNQMKNYQGKPKGKQNSRRAALTTLTNTNNIRIQPHRAVKQSQVLPDSTTDENACALKPKKAFDVATKPPFGVRSNDATNMHPVLVMPSNIPSYIDPMESTDNLEDSPMVLDSSISSSEQESISLDASNTENTRLDNLFCPAEYQQHIYNYLREAEKQYRSKVGYMIKQPDITQNMRMILVDWLVEVAEEYKLHRETVFLAVNYIDRFLSIMSVLRGKLQLVGTACMFIAAKFQEIYPPELREFVYITDDTYKKGQVLRMEAVVLKVLDFSMGAPTSNVFCDRILQFCKQPSEDVEYLSMYILELTMLDADKYLQFLPSLLAASAVCMARLMYGEPAWTSELAACTEYEIEDLKYVLPHMHTTVSMARNSQQQAIPEKYKQPKYNHVSQTPVPSFDCIKYL